jgi:hypothetical protein
MTALPRCILLLLPLAACGPGDDFLRPGTWHPTGANEANLAAMLAEPAHARAGVAARTERGQPGSQAIRLLEQDRRRPLPDSRAAAVGNIGTTPTPAAAPADAR